MKNKSIMEDEMNVFKKPTKITTMFITTTVMQKATQGLHGGVQVLLHYQHMTRDQNCHNSKISKQKYKQVWVL